ncbi:serine protease [Cupriavidus sp. TKC]|uniref:S8 family serine peptidase n=1 Tax=Cupriavidus sp. TKC TaxID=2880159 RepID=UPI0025A8D08F|nr:S8 family serine peptidase [Cupriavidus sp. TKC]GMG90538.1 serine protease [Cupriavidus sp. TKC]
MDLFNGGETGDGVRVLVLDDGLDIAHPDLKDQIAADMLHNFDPNAANQMDPTPPGNDSHGTAVGGIIGASANNSIGGRGIAPKVKLGGARLLCGGCNSPVNVLDAYGGAPFSRIAAVINGSFGSNPKSPDDFDPDGSYLGVAIQRLATLRDGKGIVFTKSAGNEYQSATDANNEPMDCSRANRAMVSCENANAQPDQAMPGQLIVGSVNALGRRASYSNAGSNVLVMGLGGEFGYPMLDPLTGVVSTSPAIVTTDLAGCLRGSVRSNQSSQNALDDPTSAVHVSLNSNCDYMATMNGTSAAAPTIAGVVALMLHANPNLTWRDVRYILMKTARRIDTARVPNTVTLPSGDTYVPEPAWTQNGAGLWFDNWYGFGLADASAAVAMAKTYTSYLTGPMASNNPSEPQVVSPDCVQTSAACGRDIPIGSAAGLGVRIPISTPALGRIEAVQILLKLGGVSPGDLAVELTSPSGTRSVLMNAYSVFTQDATDLSSYLLASYAFNEEPGNGTWILRLIDVGERANPDAGRFQAVMLTVMGH